MHLVGAYRDTSFLTGGEVSCDGQDTTGLLIFVTYGDCRISVRNRSVHLKSGDLLLCTQVEEPISFLPSAAPHEQYVLFFTFGDSDDLPILSNADKCLCKAHSEPLFLDRVKRIYHHYIESDAYRDVLCAALVMELLVYLNREVDRGAKGQAQLEMAKKMQVYIRTHRREKVTKFDVARHIERSPGYAASLFQAMTRKTISEYLHESRVEMALQLLRESELTVGDIAEFLGYSDASYFHKVFKRITGRRPKDYFAQRPRARH